MSLFRNLIQRPKSARQAASPVQAGSQAQQATPPEENYGLFEISNAAAGVEGSADEESMRQVDIVAVHGLMGHWANTWNAGNSHDDPMFLRDRIPADLSHIGVRARIFSYGYDSAVVFSKSVATIDQAASILLERLLSKRKTPEENGRPIIFIAHSLGGLVVKQAMIQAWTHSSRYNELLESVKGCLFLGVPHGGADSAYWANFPARMIPYVTFGLRGNPRFLKSLESKSADCVRISSDFVHRAMSLKIRTFYETEKLGNMIVVDRSSATLNLPNELALPLAGSNHVTICKFSASENQRYEPVKDALEELVNAGLGTTQKVSDMPLKSDMPLRTDTFCGRETELQAMAEALQPTDSRQMGLVLYGIGGSGKTQLALRYIQTYENLYKAIVWINASNVPDLEASFAEAADLLYDTAPRPATATPQKLVVSMLCNPRSSPWLLVIDSVDDLSQHDFRSCIPSCAHGSIVVTSTRANASEVFRLPNLEVDRLDESSGCQLLMKIVGDVAISETDWATPVARELHGIPLAIEHAGVLIRASLSPEQFLQSYRERYRWLLERYPERGILSYEKDRSIITVFDLLFENVKSKYPEAGALLIFLAILGTWKIPTTLLNQYQRFLPEIRSEDDQESQHLVEALSTPETLQIALSHLANACLVKRDSDRDHPYKSNTLHRAIRDWSLRTSFQGKQIWLLQATRGLVAATLNSDEQTTLSLDTLQQMRPLNQAYLVPLRQCVALVRNKIPANEIQPPFGRYRRQYAELIVDLSQVDLSCGLLSEAEKGFTEAIEYQRTQREAEWPSSQGDLALLEGLAVVSYRSAALDSCLEILASALRLAERLYGPFDPEVAAITSYLKEVSEKRERMQQHHKNVVLAVSGSKMNTRSAEASGNGVRDETPLLPSYEEHQNVLETYKSEEVLKFNTELCVAAQGGLTEKVKLLLSIEGIDPNSRDEHGNTALSWAIYRGHDAVVQMLLEVDQIDVNARYLTSSTPLYVYAERGHHKIVKMLLTRGADSTAQGGSYGNALQVACSRGYTEIVKTLLEHNADVNAQGGHYGNALHAAATEGHDKVVQMLLEREADVNAQGTQYESSLEAAAASGDDKIMQILLDKGAHLTARSLFYRYLAVRTPISPSWSSHIQMEMVAQRDENMGDRTLLHWGARCGDHTATKRCLDLGADVDATDTLGRTALHYAAEIGHLEVVETLVEAKADRKIRDMDGRTALDFALKACKNGRQGSQSDVVAYLGGQHRTISSIYSSAISSFRRA